MPIHVTHAHPDYKGLTDSLAGTAYAPSHVHSYVHGAAHHVTASLRPRVFSQTGLGGSKPSAYTQLGALPALARSASAAAVLSPTAAGSPTASSLLSRAPLAEQAADMQRELAEFEQKRKFYGLQPKTVKVVK